jgi:hypothetical protein
MVKVFEIKNFELITQQNVHYFPTVDCIGDMIAPIRVTNGALHSSFIARMKALFTYLMTPTFEKPFQSLRKICAFVEK